MIETERLIIRNYKSKDFDDFWEIFSNNKVTQSYGLGAFENKCDAWQVFEGKLKNPHVFAVVLKYSMKVIGEFSIADAMFHCSNDLGVPKEISFLANEKFQGKGYMTECGKGMIKFLFEEGNASAVYTRALASNIPSLKFSQKCGMQAVATHKEYVGMKVEDVVTSEITKKQYKVNPNYDTIFYKTYPEEKEEEKLKQSLAKKYFIEKEALNKKNFNEIKELLDTVKKEEIFLDKKM